MKRVAQHDMGIENSIDSMQEFKHSVKVPRNYKLAANILKKALTEGASVKSLVFGDKLKHFRTNVLYALICEAIKHNAEIDKLFENTEILKNESRLDPWLAKILTVELLFGKKSLPGQSKPELAVASYKEQFEKYSAENPDHIKKKGVRRPRYVRINTNLLTTSDAIRAFQDEDYRLVRCTSGPYADYLRQVSALEPYAFMQDYHVKTVFVFAPGTRLHEHPLYEEHKIILQDKATAMAVHLLAPPPGAVVMDMCAAPGMKSTQLAAYMKNQGTVYAVEQSEERYKTLCNFVEKTGSSCVTTINRDVLNIKRGEYPDVEYILLDPSCSGSGMELCAHTYIEEARLSRLTSLQEKFLKHAMHAFPKAKRIVYSTCSVFPQENERVVTNVVTQCRAKWNVLDVKELLKEQWNNFGSGMYGSIGTRCMYARPDTDLTTGFFLAVIEKDPKYLRDPETPIVEVSNHDHNVKRKRSLSPDSMDKSQGAGQMDRKENSGIEEEEFRSQVQSEKKNRKKSKKNKRVENEFSEGICDDIEVDPQPISPNNDENAVQKKSKKQKRHNKQTVELKELHVSKSKNNKSTNQDESTAEEVVNEQENDVESNAKKGKRKNVKNSYAETASDTLLKEPIEDEPKKKHSKQTVDLKELDVSKSTNNKSKNQDEPTVDEVVNEQENDVESNANKSKRKNKKNSYAETASQKLLEESIEDEPKKKKKKKKDHKLDY